MNDVAAPARGINRNQLFVASCISLVTTSMVFATRGAIEGPMSAAFHLTKEQMGLIWGPSFWGFTIAIFLCGILVDALGMRLVHALSSIGYLVGLALVLLAPRPDAAVDSIFAHQGTLMVYAGFLAMGLSQGLVEGVINPLVATMYKDSKGKMLNVLHAWWPGGMIIGGLAAYTLGKYNTQWQITLALLAIPAILSLILIIKNNYPQTERVASNVSMGEMCKEAFRPLFLLLLVMMLLTAATELGPDQWFPTVMGNLTAMNTGGVLFLVYTAGLMFVLRFFFGGVVHRFSPFAVLSVCAILAGVGLYWLGSLDVPVDGKATTSTIVLAFAAATVFGVGKTYFWPTMLGVTSELFPKGGALLMNLMGGMGMLAIAVVLPVMGKKLDAEGPGAALQTVAMLPIILLVVFGSLYLYYRARGGYKPVQIDAE